MTQYALPTSDKDVTAWQEGAGDTDGDAFDELDEGFGSGRGSGSGPDDATTYWESTNEDLASNRLWTNLSSVTDPEVSTGHIWRTRNRKDSSGGRQLDISLSLREDGVEVSQLSQTMDEVWTTRGSTLTELEANGISDYSLLEVRSRAREVGGGTPREAWESAHEFECPDAPSGAGQPTQVRTHGIPTGSGYRARPGAWN